MHITAIGVCVCLLVCVCVCNVQAKQFMIVKNCLKTQVVPILHKKTHTKYKKIKEFEIASRVGPQTKNCKQQQKQRLLTTATSLSMTTTSAASCDLLLLFVCVCPHPKIQK